MAISGTVWPLKSRRCVQNQRRARTAGTDARKALLPDHFDDVRLGRFAHGDFRHRQMEVAAEVATLDLDVDAHFIHGAVSDRFRRCATATNFLWRADAQGAVWTMDVIPDHKRIESPLDVPCCQCQQHKPLPEFQRAEKSFHSAIELGCARPASHMADALQRAFLTGSLNSQQPAITRDELIRIEHLNICTTLAEPLA